MTYNRNQKKGILLKPLQHTKKIIFLAFLLSLLFHMSSVVIVFFEKNKQQSLVQLSPEEQQQELEQAIKQQEEWVETKAHAGNFGTPVMFVDDFDIPLQTEEQKEDTLKPIEVTEEKEEEEKEKEEPVTEKSELPQEKIIEQDNITLQTLQAMAQPSPKPEKKPVIRKSPPAKKPSQPRKSTTARPSFDKLPTSPKLRSTSRTNEKPPLTLAQLTQGFLDHLKNEGSHAIHMLGKKSGKPSDEQIKYERYLEKLGWCLQNSYHINQHHFPPSAHLDDKVHVLLSLNKDGSLKHCQIAKTYGNRELDNFTLFIFNDASSSFPPVPQYLPHDPFTITYIIMVAATQENRFQMYRQ